MITETTYQKYDKRVQEYMKNLTESMVQDLGNIPDSYRVSLDLIADTLEVYMKAKDDVMKNGFMVTDLKDRNAKNPSVTVMNNCQNYLHKLLSSFGWTLLSKQKIKHLDGLDKDYLDDLMN